MAKFDFDSLIKKSEGRRIPREQPLVLASLDHAAVMLEVEPGRVGDDLPRVKALADQLMQAAKFYYFLMDRAATRDRKRGRESNIIDVSFIFILAMGLGPHVAGEITFRKYVVPSKADVGGKERPTKFQEHCNSWMALVDPERSEPIQAAAYKAAGRHWRRRVRD